ncbi:MAG: hypothetical protein IK066_03365, partial [Kiritimatiellae bacterium]|nr:hypothetical protein [Kiritimatiellia bacterium]
MEPVSLDFALLSTVTNLLPDTSGLAPLSLPAEFLPKDNGSQPPPSPDAIRRFQSALSTPPDTPSPSSSLAQTILLSSASQPPAPPCASPLPQESAPLPSLPEVSSLPSVPSTPSEHSSLSPSSPPSPFPVSHLPLSFSPRKTGE